MRKYEPYFILHLLCISLTFPLELFINPRVALRLSDRLLTAANK